MSRTIAFRIVLAAAVLVCFTGIAAAASDPPAPGSAASGVPAAEAAGFPPVATPDPVVAWMAGQVRQDEVAKSVAELSGELPVTIGDSSYTIQSRHMYSGIALENAAAYVAERLARSGLTVEYHRWGGPSSAPNVIGEKRGIARPDEIYVLAAHLDDMPLGIAPGADDDASGCAAVLAAAKILSQFSWDCTLRFAFWTGNEQGFDGSSRYASRAAGRGENIAGLIDLDMIGWRPSGGAAADLHANSDIPLSVDLANQVASGMNAYGLGLAPQVFVDGYSEGDHLSFWRYGYSAILGAEHNSPGPGGSNPYYHTAGDRLSTLDLAYLTGYTRAAVAATAHMAGCLTTGRIEGRVTAAHDGSPVPNAELVLRDSGGRQYVLHLGGDGRYSQAIPPASYSLTVSAYGYAELTTSGIRPPVNGSVTQEMPLVALPPTAPSLTVALDAGEAGLAWQHVAPNTAYRVRRSADPYFVAAGGVVVAEVNATHPPAPGETLTYRDPDSGAGDASVNHYYAVQGINAAGATAGSDQMGEFDYQLARPAGPD